MSEQSGFECPICRKSFSTAEEADACGKRETREPQVNVGQEVRYNFFFQCSQFRDLSERENRWIVDAIFFRVENGRHEPYASVRQLVKPNAAFGVSDLELTPN